LATDRQTDRQTNIVKAPFPQRMGGGLTGVSPRWSRR